MLESAGMTTFLRNEISAGLTGDLPLNEITPELWITDDSKLAEAMRIKKLWQEPIDKGAAWVCPSCGETCESQFSSCWKCGTTRTE